MPAAEIVDPSNAAAPGAVTAGARNSIRILHVVDTMQGMGGMEAGVVNLIQRMDPGRFEHVVCVLRSLGALAERIPRDRAQVVCLGRNRSGRQFHAWAMAREIERFRPHVIHSRNWGAIEAVFASCWAGTCAIVHSEHGMDSNSASEPWRRRWLRRLAYQLADQVVAVSHELRDRCARRTGFPAANIAVIHNGVDLTRFAPAETVRRRMRQRLGIAPEEFCIGAVGRLEPVKDILSLLRAFATLADSCGRSRLLIAGDGTERAGLEEFARGHPGLRHRVAFLGEMQDVPEFLNALDVYALPSLYEGLSNSLLEAMASGLPVVASAVGGNSEVLGDGYSGLLFPAGDPAALVQRLQVMHEQPEQRLRMGRQNLDRVQRHFSIESMVHNYERLYENMARR